MIFPPGTILQRMYIKQRLKLLVPGHFIEIGVGNGELSKLLCSLGWKGVGFELHAPSIEVANKNILPYIQKNQYETRNENWLHTHHSKKADIIISSMVLEHLNEEDETSYLQKCKSLLTDHGKVILLVPASMMHWGVEDEIAGHYRRYTFETLQLLMQKNGLKISHMAGLTYPLSNMLLPLSNFLVKRAETQKLHLSLQERTEHSGHRHVKFKTTFPFLLKIFLNEIFMYPLFLLQKMNRNNAKAMVIYLECEKVS